MGPPYDPCRGDSLASIKVEEVVAARRSQLSLGTRVPMGHCIGKQRCSHSGLDSADEGRTDKEGSERAGVFITFRSSKECTPLPTHSPSQCAKDAVEHEGRLCRSLVKAEPHRLRVQYEDGARTFIPTSTGAPQNSKLQKTGDGTFVVFQKSNKGELTSLS